MSPELRGILKGRGENVVRSMMPFAFLAALSIQMAAFAQPAWAQEKAQTTQAATPSAEDAKERNLNAYIDLLRSDVRQQKAEIMGAVMLLSADDAAKFWPIYSEYDAELTRLNDQRVANIKEYADSYDEMTEAKADELIQKALAFQKQRADLLAKTYERVKQSLGAITAARFVQIEHQLLLIIDLQIISRLPVVSKES